MFQLNQLLPSCCHVVNLACKAILSAISKLDYTYINFDSSMDTFMDILKQDPIVAIRVLIKVASH